MAITELNRYELETSAAYLFDGGWRAKDKEWLKDEYKFTDEELNVIVEALNEIEQGEEIPLF